MDYIHLSIVGAVAGTLSMIFVYTYLYYIYRERCMGVWSISWLILFLRNIIFDSELFKWKQTLLGFALYQLMFIACSLMFIWGTYIFIEKPFNKRYIYIAFSASVISVFLLCTNAPVPYKVIPSAWFASIVLFRLAIAFLTDLKLGGVGSSVTGYAFLSWSLLTFIFPFLPFSSYVWVNSISCILRVTIATGTLLVYFEKMKIDLTHKEEQYRRLTDNAIDIIYRYRLVPERKFEYISPSALLVTGYFPAEYYANSQLFFNIIHPEDSPLFDKIIASPSFVTDLPLAFRLVRKDGAVVWVEQKHVAVYDKNNCLIALEGIIRDVTARKKLEHMAATLDRMNLVGNMAATVAHEIRNPMTTVRGLLQFLSRKNEYQADNRHFDSMIEEIDRANTIIGEYLSLSREKVSQLTPCSLNHIIELMFPLMQASATASKASIVLALSDIPELLLDENEIRQLLLNLVRNGIEAMSSGGTLRIHTFLDSKRAVLSIADQGPGIPPHILQQLGTPFITTKDMGTGLGLAICYQIVHRHQAEIQVNTSEHGTTFFIYFPIPTR